MQPLKQPIKKKKNYAKLYSQNPKLKWKTKNC